MVYVMCEVSTNVSTKDNYVLQLAEGRKYFDHAKSYGMLVYCTACNTRMVVVSTMGCAQQGGEQVLSVQGFLQHCIY